MSGFLRRILLLCVALTGCRSFSPAAGPTAFETGAEIQARLERQAVLPEPETDDSFARCVFFHQRGWANFSLGRYDQAMPDLKRALALNPQETSPIGEWCKRWRIQDDIDKTFNSSGDHVQRIAFLKTVADELRYTNIRRYFFSQLKLIRSYIALGMFEEGEAAFQRASIVLQDLPGVGDWEDEHHNILDRYYKEASELREARGRHVDAEASWRISLHHAELYAAKWARSGSPSFKRVVQDNKTGVMLRLAANLAAQGRPGEARHLVREALADTLELNSFYTANTSGLLSVLGNIDLQQGRLDDALRYFDMARRAQEGSSAKLYSTALARIRDRIGLIYCMQGKWSEALAMYEVRDRGLRSGSEQASRVGSNTIDWAMALLRSGDSAKAVEMLQKLLRSRLARQFSDSLDTAHVQGYLGIALLEQGEHSRAFALFREALPSLLTHANEAGQGDSAGFVAVHRMQIILEGYLDLLSIQYATGDELLGLDVASEAFTIADLARNSSVQRAVTASAARAALPDAQLGRLARREQDTSSQIRSLNRTLDRLASNPAADQVQTGMHETRREIDRLLQEHATLKQELAGKYPDYADLVAPKPVAPADIQQALKPDETVVSIYSAPRKTFVWTVTPQELVFRVIPLTREQLSHEVGKVLRSLELTGGKTKAFDAAASHRLFSMLMEPDAARWGSGKLINIIPHGVIGQLPFAVLLSDPVGNPAKSGHAEWPWLIAKVAIAQQPSASAFMALRNAPHDRREQQPFVGFGDPVFMADARPATQRGPRFRNLVLALHEEEELDFIEQAQKGMQSVRGMNTRGKVSVSQVFSRLPALPDTAEELGEIAATVGADPQTALFLGARATESNVKNTDLSRYRIVAFATHGLRPEQVSGLDQPALAMANPALTGDIDNDGLLSLDEVLRLKLNAEWVVLSACDTASGDGRGTEAASGLGRAFFFAGARSLLLSHWAVETGSARLLTTGLFAQQKDNPAMRRAEALRQSMLGVMKSDVEDYSHPFYWAPFSLMGNGTTAY